MFRVLCYKYYKVLMNTAAAVTLIHLRNILYLKVVWPILSP